MYDEHTTAAERRIKARTTLRDAKSAIQTSTDAADRSTPELEKWLVVILAAEKEAGNVISDDDAVTYLGKLQEIAGELRLLGQRNADSIAGCVQGAVDQFMAGQRHALRE